MPRSQRILLVAVTVALVTGLVSLATAPQATAQPKAEAPGEICFDQGDCRGSKFCNKPDGGCAPQVRGRCTDRPVACPRNLSPVCGCDGETYSNACEARRAGTSVAAQGQCVQSCRANRDCKGDELCHQGAGRCRAEGVCRDRPEQCPILFRPEWVCGCDGEIYTSSCEALKAGTSVAADGECVQTCRANGDCKGNQLCQRDPGRCRADGACRDRPEQCPSLIRPEWVCGCDGKTYSSSCRALKAGTSVAAEGKCVQPCRATADCQAGELCYKVEGQCRSGGVCRDRPQACTRQYDPVCGCDGKTYSNSCYAWHAGTTVSAEGECESPCRVNRDCETDELCLKDEGRCQSGGVCQDRPGACTRQYAPVCGCDGKTYSNPCYARRAGASVRSQGKCPTLSLGG